MSAVDAGQTHSDEPTTEKGREQFAEYIATEGPIEAGSYEWNFIGRLIADVARLDRQLGDELAADSVLCPHAPNHLLEVKRLEAEVKRLEVKGCPQCPHCHPDSRWP